MKVLLNYIYYIIPVVVGLISMAVASINGNIPSLDHENIDLNNDDKRYKELYTKGFYTVYNISCGLEFVAFCVYGATFWGAIIVGALDTKPEHVNIFKVVLNTLHIIFLLCCVIWTLVVQLKYRNTITELNNILNKGRLYWCNKYTRNKVEFDFENFTDKSMKILDLGFETHTKTPKQLSVLAENEFADFEANTRNRIKVNCTSLPKDFNKLPVTVTQYTEDGVLTFDALKAIPVYFYIKTNEHTYYCELG